MDLSNFSKETLIKMVYDLQKEVNKFKIYAEKRITEIEKLLESQIDFISRKTLKIDTMTQTEDFIVKEKKDDYFDISKYENVWYMNGNAYDLDNWDLRVKNKFVTSWNDNGKNNSLLNKVKKGDLIAWYIVGKGYNSILEVIGEVHEITDKELELFCNIKDKRKSMKEHNYTILSIPVDFLVTSDKSFINNTKKSRIKDSEWTNGLRGSHCIKPRSEKWLEQVEDIYVFLKSGQN